MNNPIGFLLGAGASHPYGVPAMAAFYSAFRDHLMKRHPRHFALLQRLESGKRHAAYDLETLLSDLQLAMMAQESLALLGVDVDDASLAAVDLAELRGFLDAFIIDTCERFDRQNSAVEMTAILNLQRFGPLWIFTTNYDRIVEQACEHNGIGFSDGFRAPLGEPVADWSGEFEAGVRVVKLHGSVNWYRDNPGDALHRLDRGYSLPSKDFALVREGQRLTPLMIIPTLEKQVLERPYVDLTVRFTDILRDLPLLIVAGNSLRDQHLLNYVRYRLPRLQVLVVGPRASQLANRLQLGPAVHALDVGFRELLVTSAAGLIALAERLSGWRTADDVSTAVRQFIEDVSANAETEAVLQANPEFALYGRMLADESMAQRARGAAALGNHSHPAIVRKLAAVLKNDPEESVRTAAVSALIRLGTADAIASAAAALKDPSTSVQLEAVVGLVSRLPDASVKTVLESAAPSLAGPAKRILDAEMVTPARSAEGL